MPEGKMTVEETKQLSRTTHYALREQLLQLCVEVIDKPQRELLETQIATNMRSLFDYHRVLYESEQDYPLSIDSQYQMQKFFEWRSDILGSFGDDSFESNEENDSYFLFKTDRPRFQRLFQPMVLPEQITNHWHIKISGDSEMDFGHLHKELTWGKMMSYFIPGRESNFYNGQIIREQSTPTIKIDKTGRIDMRRII